MEDSTAFKDPQLWAPSLSQAALENYNDIDDYLKTIEVEETEMKKKKKKKKKKANPASTPNNPILFYTVKELTESLHLRQDPPELEVQRM
ncbi:hypothetical protein PGTUg99_024084 [Puccinia graminis f. sp. tritici]|uniref:Uncharacterized protein n=1 Tax=Puccinia graminis f. sp. tritici TaxID=56615 RepID=A0A5B0NEM0_PUCGR|nr:hypothetical protein PGTUg99_024084 [Puccinia graminis f. sp. tritici]